MPAAKIFSNAAIIQRIFVLSDDNSQFARVNKLLHETSLDSTTKMKWIINRPDQIVRWMTSFQAVVSNRKIFDSFAHWLSYYYFSPPVHSAVERLLSKNEMLLMVLEYYCKIRNTKFISFFWKLLASKGSLLGLELARSSTLLKDLLRRQIDMVTAVYYPAIFHANQSRDENMLKAVDILTCYEPMAKSIIEMICYSTKENHLELVHLALNFEKRYIALFWAMDYAHSHGNTQILQAFIDIINDEERKDWQEYVRACDYVEKDDDVAITSYMANVYANRISPVKSEYFVDVWNALVDRSLRTKKFKCLDVFLETRPFPDAELNVSILSLSIPVMDDDFISCDMLVPLLDCSDIEPVSEIGRLEFLLQQFCLMRPFNLFTILYPLSDKRDSDEAKEYVNQFQMKLTTYLVKKLQFIDPAYVVKSSLIWTAFVAGNKKICDNLIKLGGEVSWMDSKTKKDKQQNEPIKKTALYEVDDASSCLFRGYGGVNLTFYDPTLINAPLFEECAALSALYGKEFAQTMRGSVNSLNGDAKVEKIPRLGLGRKPPSIRIKNDAGRIKTKRIPTRLHESSDSKWTEYFNAMNSKDNSYSSLNMEVSTLFTRDVSSMDWMDTHYTVEAHSTAYSTKPVDTEDTFEQLCALY